MFKKEKLNDEKISDLGEKYGIPGEYYYFNLGKAYCENKQGDQAIHCFKKVFNSINSNTLNITISKLP